jgi:hypothetical protein
VGTAVDLEGQRPRKITGRFPPVRASAPDPGTGEATVRILRAPPPRTLTVVSDEDVAPGARAALGAEEPLRQSRRGLMGSVLLLGLLVGVNQLERTTKDRRSAVALRGAARDDVGRGLAPHRPPSAPSIPSAGASLVCGSTDPSASVAAAGTSGSPSPGHAEPPERRVSRTTAPQRSSRLDAPKVRKRAVKRKARPPAPVPVRAPWHDPFAD